MNRSVVQGWRTCPKSPGWRGFFGPARSKRAFTIIELLICITIVIGLVYVMFQVLYQASNTRAVANAKGVAKNEVEVALRQIARDLSRARAPSLADYEQGKKALTVTANSVAMIVSEPTSTGINEVPVTYNWDLAAKTLTRIAENKPHIYTNHLEEMSIDYAGVNPDTGVKPASGTVLVIMGTKVQPEGNNKPQIHHQEMMVTIQEEMRKNMDGKWRKAEDITSKF